MIQELLDLGYKYQATNDYYFKDYGDTRISIKKKGEGFVLSNNPFEVAPLKPFDNIEDLKKHIETLESIA